MSRATSWTAWMELGLAFVTALEPHHEAFEIGVRLSLLSLRECHRFAFLLPRSVMSATYSNPGDPVEHRTVGSVNSTGIFS